MREWTRREILGAAAAFLAEPVNRSDCHGSVAEPIFRTRGVVIYPEDLSLKDWPERAAKAGLSTIALHHGSSPSHVIAFVKSDAGQRFLETCRRLNVAVEYELHAMHELLPRSLFERDPSLFRMNDKGERTPDANLCVHSNSARAIVAENALKIGAHLRPTTGRYFLWGDDGAAWCRCPLCKGFSDSDQALLLENHLIQTMTKHDSLRDASLAHLAYANTIGPPTQVKPEPRVFLEFAPIHRRYDVAYAEQHDLLNGLDSLDANLDVFPRESAQALEYWLDMSRFSGWKRPVAAIPWYREVFLEDLKAYSMRGIRNVTSFAAWIDAEYLKNHHDLTFIQEYGEGLSAPR